MVGKGVQRHVHPAVGGQVLRLRFQALQQIDPAGIEAGAGEALLRRRPQGRGAEPEALQDQREAGTAASSRPQARKASSVTLAKLLKQPKTTGRSPAGPRSTSSGAIAGGA